jgi:hypothetical protein
MSGECGTRSDDEDGIIMMPSGFDMNSDHNKILLGAPRVADVPVGAKKQGMSKTANDANRSPAVGAQATLRGT